MRCTTSKARNTFVVLFIITVTIFVINIWIESIDLSILKSSEIAITINDTNIECKSHSIFCDKSLAIIGLVYNSSSTIQHVLNQLQILSCSFKDVIYIFYESNSEDDTATILQNWQQNHDKVSICPLTKITKIILDVLSSDINHENENIDRTEKYAKYRNYLLRELLMRYSKKSLILDYVLMIDMDIISFDPIITLNEMDYLMNNMGYDIMCNHGIFGKQGWYYDVFATIFMDQSWTRFDFWDWPFQRAKLDEIINSNNFTQVLSCFNGITIYKFQAIQQSECKYLESEKELKIKYPQFIDKYLIKFREIKENDNAMICEHIPFHYCLIENGHKIVISRDALVYYTVDSLNFTLFK